MTKQRLSKEVSKLIMSNTSKKEIEAVAVDNGTTFDAIYQVIYGRNLVTDSNLPVLRELIRRIVERKEKEVEELKGLGC